MIDDLFITEWISLSKFLRVFIVFSFVSLRPVSDAPISGVPSVQIGMRSSAENSFKEHHIFFKYYGKCSIKCILSHELITRK